MFNNNNVARFLGLACLLGQAMAQAHAGSTDIADYPVDGIPLAPPNVLVIYDNSQSMDAFMNGTPVAGSHPDTRSNIGRSILRDTISKGRARVKWGLMSFALSGAPVLRNTYASYMGSNTGMVFTDDCVGFVASNPPTAGVSASNGGRRCIKNPQSFAGGNFITFDKSGDDADIQSVLHDASVYPSLWGIDPTDSTYNMYSQHDALAGNSWLSSDFTGSLGSRNFSSTDADAGFLPSAPAITRQVFTPRGWGYSAGITGMGQLDVSVAADSDAQQSSLQSKLAGETSGATGELKNGAIFTPLRGALQSAKSYFSGTTSPVQRNCQRNFVMLVTDGLPTGKADGTQYSAAERANTCNWSTDTNSCTSGSFGQAARDAIAAAKALRYTAVPGYFSPELDGDGPGPETGQYDIKTYVVALGDTVANPKAMSVMNAIAHAGGTEAALPAGDAKALKYGIDEMLGDRRYMFGTTEAYTLSSTQLIDSPTGNKLYRASYQLDQDLWGLKYRRWGGDVTQSFMSGIAGHFDYTIPSAWVSSAGVQLKSRSAASRFIATSTDVPGSRGGIQFQPTSAATATKLSAAQQSLLGTPPAATDGAAVLAFLRGDKSQDGLAYRNRNGVSLGPIINSGVVLVKPPNAGHVDAGYSAFKAAHASRPQMLYVGANDGMLHAFDEATGAESWAYVPNLVMAGLNRLTAKTHFVHEQSVDATPVSADVDFGAGNWRTLLVGGLRKGGRGYYALDVTTAGAASEAEVANKVLWEFPNSISNATARASATLNMGYSFGKPLLVKTAAGWVVLVTSGYNNGSNAGDSGGDGLGHLYVINPETGDLIRDIPTPGCTASPATDPCGLAQISASLTGNTADHVYGGDLKGNLWRFDLTPASPTAWSVTKFTTLVDSDGIAQPVTTKPAVSNVSGMRIIQVGTGQLLGVSDFSTTQTQTMYGLRDTLPPLAPLRSSLQKQTLSLDWLGIHARAVSSNHPVDYATQHGWYVDLTQPGERVNTTPDTDDLGNLVFTTSVIEEETHATWVIGPPDCRRNANAWVYHFSSKTGGMPEYHLGPFAGLKLILSFAAAPLLIRSPAGHYDVLVSTFDGSMIAGARYALVPPPLKIKRSWRQLYLY